MPVRGWVGLALAIGFWAFNWALPRENNPATWGFFPMWLGYCLVVDALVYRRKGTSLAARSPWGYAALFVLSAPAWWLFEWLNARVQNWSYEGGHAFDEPGYALLASLSFSTVMPAVFGTAELVSTFGWVRRMGRARGFAIGPRTTGTLFAAGWLMLGLLLVWPRCFFPLLWLSVYFILDPWNVWMGNRSLLAYPAKGDWRPVVSLSVGCLICGFFWEMWNYYSYPKWIYDVPGVSFLHVFEMPLLGYGGYVPFAWELFALYHLVAGPLRRRAAADFIELLAEPPAAPAAPSEG